MARKTKAEAELTRLQILDAARRVFHNCGVSRSSLEKVAQEAGVTRGAVYWHFANKAELFFAVRDEFTQGVRAADAALLSDEFPDALEGIAASMLEFFRLLKASPHARQTFEIMMLRCEYVEEFTPVLQVVNEPCSDFKHKLGLAYQKAASQGVLRPGLDPEEMAADSLAFITGLFNQWISLPEAEGEQLDVPRRIHTHLNLRRPAPVPAAAPLAAAKV